jgi:hypothetical protein
MSEDSKIIIHLDDAGHCTVHAPESLSYGDVVEILSAALDATIAKAAQQDADDYEENEESYSEEEPKPDVDKGVEVTQFIGDKNIKN